MLNQGENVTGRFEFALRQAPYFRLNGKDKIMSLITEEAPLIIDFGTDSLPIEDFNLIINRFQNNIPTGIGDSPFSVDFNAGKVVFEVADQVIFKRKNNFSLAVNNPKFFIGAFERDKFYGAKTVDKQKKEQKCFI